MSKSVKVIPSNPIRFEEGLPLGPRPELGVNYPQNIWRSLEQMQAWFGEFVLAVNSDKTYQEPLDDLLPSGSATEADRKRTSDEKYTDQRGLESLRIMLGVESPSRMRNEFARRSVVDIGSGAGVLSDDLRRYAKAAHVLEVDYSEELLNDLPPVFQGRGDRLCADGTNLPLEDGIADRTIAMFSTTIHTQTIEARLRGIAEAIRITKVDGRAFVAPLIGGMALRQERWLRFVDNIDRFDLSDPKWVEFLKTIQQVAAMDYAIVDFTRELMLQEKVSLTPRWCFQPSGNERYDCVSATFEVHEPFSKSEAEVLIESCRATFNKT